MTDDLPGISACLDLKQRGVWWLNQNHRAHFRFEGRHGYGNKPSTRIGTAIGVGLICWPCGIAGLFIKAKHHFLTVEFTQGANKQAVVFELGKALPQTMLPILEVKTGRKIVYQDNKNT